MKPSLLSLPGMLAALLLGFLLGCSSPATRSNPQGPPGGSESDGGASADGGVNVDTAAAKYPDLRTLWARSISRTCGPNNGVCHDSRQFPDMQTASGLLGAVGIRCNQIRDQAGSIDNLCEPPGDELQIGTFKTRIGNVTPDSQTAPTQLTVTLHDPIPQGTTGAMAVVRERQGLATLTFAIPKSAVVSSTGQSVIVSYAALNTNATPAPAPPGATNTMAVFLDPASYVPGDDTQVELGDPNGDGVFGADLGGALIKPGDPLNSYLFLRITSPLDLGPGNTQTNVSPSMAGQTEPQMPIANFQYWDIDNDALALWCWISNMAPDGSNADGPIDYTSCDTSKMPSPHHQGGEASTFSSVFSNILQPNCSSCHHAGGSAPSSFQVTDLDTTYDNLLGFGTSGPTEVMGMPFVTRDDPTHSYLFLKITGDPSITGARMPLGGQLQQGDIDAIGTWVSQGANND